MDSILFYDYRRQDEIDMFYEAAQRYRDYYRGYPKAYHPLLYFMNSQYTYQCPDSMTEVYMSYPPYHVKYKQPAVLPNTVGSTTPLPPLPGRTLAGRFNKAACKAYFR